MSELPRLLLCTFDVLPAPTGTSRRLTEYLKGLADRFTVVVLSAKTPDVSHIEKYQGARLLRVPVGTGDLASRLQAFDRAVRRQLESEEYAIVHFMDPFGGYALCEQRDSYGYRLIYEALGFPSQELRYTHPQTEGDRRFVSRLRRQELYCLMNAERVITGSAITADYIHSLGVSQTLVHVLPAPVDLGPFTPQALGAPDAIPMKVLYLGSQVGWQGLPTLLRAMAHALKRADLRLVLVGPKHPDWQPHLADLVEELKLSGKVEFQDPVSHDDLYKVLATCDAGVLPLEDSPRNQVQGGACSKVSEYLAAGRPVVAADLPVARRALPESAALFFKPGDAAALGDRLLELAANPARRVEMGRKARAFAEAQLDASTLRGRLIDLYDGLLGTPRRGGARSRESGEDKEITPGAGSPTPKQNRDTDPAMHLEGGAPVILGQSLEPDARDAPASTTEPEARASDAPVVLGAPLREAAAPALTEREIPVSAAQKLPPPPMTLPAVPRAGPPVLFPMRAAAIPADDEPEEISNDEIIEAGEVSPVPSALDPWFAQIAQGYCPPDGSPFARPDPFPPARPSGSRARPRREEDSSPGFKP